MPIATQPSGLPAVAPSRRVIEFGGEGALTVAAAARRLEAAGRDVLHLEIGEPGVPTPPHIVEAGIREDYGVALLPGTAFGPGGAGHLRLSLAAPAEVIAKGLACLGRCAAGLSAP